MPPQGLDTSLPESPGALTTRARYEPLNALEACKHCHDPIAGLGFAFENLDALGQWRSTENGTVVDASGWVTVDGADNALASLDDMGRIFAASQDVEACLIRQWLRYAMGRWETRQDSSFIDDLTANLTLETEGMTALIRAVVTHPRFSMVWSREVRTSSGAPQPESEPEAAP